MWPDETVQSDQLSACKTALVPAPRAVPAVPLLGCKTGTSTIRCRAAAQFNRQALPMRDQRDSAPFYARRTYRLVSGLFGTFLICVGLYALLFAGPLTALSIAVGLALVVLGGNMVVAAYSGRESWLSRLGPLP